MGSSTSLVHTRQVPIVYVVNHISPKQSSHGLQVIANFQIYRWNMIGKPDAEQFVLFMYEAWLQKSGDEITGVPSIVLNSQTVGENNIHFELIRVGHELGIFAQVPPIPVIYGCGLLAIRSYSPAYIVVNISG
jgi:hypothetical protein